MDNQLISQAVSAIRDLEDRASSPEELASMLRIVDQLKIFEGAVIELRKEYWKKECPVNEIGLHIDSFDDEVSQYIPESNVVQGIYETEKSISERLPNILEQVRSDEQEMNSKINKSWKERDPDKVRSLQREAEEIAQRIIQNTKIEE